MFAGSYRPFDPGNEAMREQLLGLRHAALGQRDRLVLLVDDVVAGRFERLAILGLDVALRDRAHLQLRDDAIDLVVQVGRFLPPGPEMISGVRASSMRMLSTSSTIA